MGSFVTMVVCLSQSDKNGGESWYSLQYGERLAGLSANISKSEVRNFDDLLRETKKRLEEESKAVERLHKTGGETNPWFGKRTMMVSQVIMMTVVMVMTMTMTMTRTMTMTMT